MQEFLRQLKIQRWDDHRFYHQSLVNQTLHLISALSFLVAYVLVFFDPAAAALVGWLISMATRQSGHFFFEPLGFDEVNNVTNEYKEAVKVGYNLQRKMVLIGIWVAVPLFLWIQPSFFGWYEADTSFAVLMRHTGEIWFALGAGALLFRTVHLFFIKDVMSGLVWMTKILTDPFHDSYLYHKAPLQLMQKLTGQSNLSQH